MIINLKSALRLYHPSLGRGLRHACCDLRSCDPDFNKGHGERFFRAFDRAIRRGDFK